MNADELTAFTTEVFFLDTNIFAYLFDPTAPDKQYTANFLVERALQSGQGVISSQVVQEFLNLAGRKFAKSLNISAQHDFLRGVLLPLCAHYPSSGFYSRTLDVMAKTKFSLYDNLMVTAALDCGCNYLFSEDLQDRRVIQGMTIVNPFSK